ncbi:MAG: 30S ribosomal protein S20 [Candidatus Kerfeldbacteria bacterium]|nr:30S ribosomal protein S20 [Candidatus Kerfeldbacteria bacterium]
MPIKKSAFKELRKSEKRRARNLAVKSTLKKAVKAVRKATAQKDKTKAAEGLKTVIPVIDRAARKGVIKRNTAARLKSKLHAAVRKLG